ncbi:SLAM family member 9-like [Melanotaenia boesemani]|uniref:SLAM family member 9-like n=1 Tax=Melanotaenia boesemani TaxID=1250792 RepID=UPI001C051061|nr:SLAM family member 9-like [Melanotaenia boesemani]
MSLSVNLVLLLCIQTPVSCAVTPVFVKKGDDVLLNVTETDVPEEFIAFMWKFSTNVLVSFAPGQKPNIRAKYAGRVELDVNKYSVKLKNLQKSDSGVYTAQMTGDQEKNIAAYNVTVQDPVSPVRLMVDSVSSRSDSCNLTVTCSAVDSDFSHTFRCDNKVCYQEGGEITKSDASFQVYPQDESIICNHSNQVSWTKHMIKIQDHCIQHDGSETLFGVSICLLKTVVFSVGLIIMVSAVISVHLMEKLKKQK